MLRYACPMPSPEGPAWARCCASLTGAPLSEADAVQLAGVLKAIAVPARLRLLSLIACCEDAESSGGDLVAALGLSQPTVSHHLNVLSAAGLLHREKRGTVVHFRLVPAALDAVAAILTTEVDDGGPPPRGQVRPAGRVRRRGR